MRLPDVTLVAGEGGTWGTIGLGAKVGGQLSERWSVSVVPEISLDPASGAVGAQMNGNVALALGGVGLWGHGSATGIGDEGLAAVLVGGGASVNLGEGGGLLVNAGGTLGSAPFVGAGGWWMISDAAQLDLGADLFLGESPALVPMLGLAVGI